MATKAALVFLGKGRKSYLQKGVTSFYFLDSVAQSPGGHSNLGRHPHLACGQVPRPQLPAPRLSWQSLAPAALSQDSPARLPQSHPVFADERFPCSHWSHVSNR
eukprot:TRINITY_DN15996_c0_g1_i1.p2 TRINITY_DN15996_c0_g1~~TRINITY_DN15996_c0_g1_i1.p2  ORF type:complete len:104 (+),score=6.77 TRINITY_DN15996_c0_g1_i1:61-372(+)